MGYYEPYRRRVKDLIKAQYSSDLSVLKNFIRRYNITHWLVEKNSFNAGYIKENDWILQHEPEAQKTLTDLQTGLVPILTAYQDKCSIFNDEKYQIISADCILERDRKISSK